MRPWSAVAFSLTVSSAAIASDPDTFAVPEGLPVVPVDLTPAAPAVVPEAAPPVVLPVAEPAAEPTVSLPAEPPAEPTVSPPAEPTPAPPTVSIHAEPPPAPPTVSIPAEPPAASPAAEIPAIPATDLSTEPVAIPAPPREETASEAEPANPSPPAGSEVSAASPPAPPIFEPPHPPGRPINGRWWQILHNTRTAIADGTMRAITAIGDGIEKIGDRRRSVAAPPVTPPEERPLAIPGDAPPPIPPPNAPLAPDCVCPEDPPRSPDRSEDERREEREERRAGFWAGADWDAGALQGGPARVSTVDLGFHLYRRFYVSGVLGGSDEAGLGFVGVRPSFILGPTDNRIRPRVDLLLGIGVHETEKVLPVNVIQPRAALELGVGRWGAIDVHAGWQHVPSWQSPGLSGATVGAGFRVGWL